MNLNRATLMGRVAERPELKHLPTGKNVASFSLATNLTYKNAENEKVEKVTWHRCIAYGKLADTLAQYVVKGQILFVEGRIDNRSYEKQDGSGKGYVSEVIVENFNFGPKPQASTGATRGDVARETIDTLGDEEVPPENLDDF